MGIGPKEESVDLQKILQLREAYSFDNLTKITSKLLALFKNEDYRQIRSFLSKIGQPASNKLTNRQLLAKCMLLYHPDKLSYYHNILDGPLTLDTVSGIDHILVAIQLTEGFGKQSTFSSYPTDLYQQPSVWEKPETPRSYYFDEEQPAHEDHYENVGTDFYSILRRDIYGPENVPLPSFLLQDMDELELSGRGMDDLDGIEDCTHLVYLDLSQNALSNLENLANLVLLEEIYVSDNCIGYIDALSNLKSLRIFDASNNQIDDISPLLELTNLEFINLAGNPVPTYQIELLRSRECVVEF